MSPRANSLFMMLIVSASAGAQSFSDSVVTGLKPGLSQAQTGVWVGPGSVAHSDTNGALRIRRSYGEQIYTCAEWSGRTICETRGIGFEVYLLSLRTGSNWLDLLPLSWESAQQMEGAGRLTTHTVSVGGGQTRDIYLAPQNALRAMLSAGGLQFDASRPTSFHRADVDWYRAEMAAWQEPALRDCDHGARSEFDPLHPAPDGISATVEEMRRPVTVNACRSLGLKYPSHPRLWFHYGRTLDASGNVREAELALQRAALHSYPAAFLELSMLKERSPAIADRKAAVELARQAVREGVSAGLMVLGLMYRNGRGVERNEGEAFRYFEAAAAAGDSVGTMLLGTAYYYGEGVPRDHDKAMAVFSRLYLSKPYPYAAYMMGLIELYRRGNSRAALPHFRNAADRGNVSAQWELGSYYYFDERNPQQAFPWLQRAAEGGSAPAQFIAGYQCLRGEGTLRNTAKALEWIGRASDQGLGQASLTLAELYRDGVDVSRDTARARSYYDRAAQSSDAKIRASALQGLRQLKSNGSTAGSRADSGGSFWVGVAAVVLGAWAISELTSSNEPAAAGDADAGRRREERRRQAEADVHRSRALACSQRGGYYTDWNGLCNNALF